MAKRGRVLTAIGVLALGVVGGVMGPRLGGGPPPHAQEAAPQVVTAQAFRLVDAAGNERGVLGIVEGKAALLLKDAEGRKRIALGDTGGDEPHWAVVMLDAEGRDRFMCGARADGDGSGLGIRDWNGILRVGLGAARGGCGLALRNESDEPRVSAGVGPGGPHAGGDFALMDRTGADIWRASQHIAR
jgi:hypothetical protein